MGNYKKISITEIELGTVSRCQLLVSVGLYKDDLFLSMFTSSGSQPLPKFHGGFNHIVTGAQQHPIASFNAQYAMHELMNMHLL